MKTLADLANQHYPDLSGSETACKQHAENNQAVGVSDESTASNVSLGAS